MKTKILPLYHFVAGPVIRGAFALLVSLAFSANLPAQAVREAAAPPSADIDEDIVVLEEFNVTEKARVNEWVSTQALSGTRTAEQIVNLPYQINIVTAEFMQDFDMVSTVDQLSTISGVVVEADQADPAIGSSASITGAATRLRGFQSIITRDGFKYAQPPQVSNTQQIEVVKGPISALYGAAQPGGIINYVSKRPTATPRYEAWLTAGNYNRFNPGFLINTPIYKRKIYFLASVDQNNRRSDIQYVKADTITAYGSVLFKPFRSTNLTISYETQHLEGLRQSSTPNRQINTLPADGSTNERDWNPYSGTVVGIWWPWVEYGMNNSGPNEWYNRDYDRLHIQLEQRFGKNWTLKAGFQWQHKTFDQEYSYDSTYSETTGYLRGIFPLVRFQDYKYPYAFQGDLLGNFKTGKIRHSLLFTADFSTLELDAQNWRLSAARETEIPVTYRYRDPFNPDWDISWFSYAEIRSKDRNNPNIRVSSANYTNADMMGFSMVERMFLFNERLVLMGSLRYDETNYEFQSYNATTQPYLKGDPGFPPWITGNENKLTYSVGFNWKVLKEDKFVVFANYSTSFNTIVTVDEGLGVLLPNETGKGFEGGVKLSTPNKKATMVLSAFEINKYDIPQGNPDYIEGDGSPQYLGTGHERIRGADVDISWSATKGLTLLASAAYLDPIVVDSTNTRMIDNRKTSTSTKTMALSAKYQFSGMLRGFSAGVRMNYRNGWVRAYYTPATPTSAERAYEWIGGVTLWGGFVRYDWKSGKLRQSIALTTSNVFDKIHTGNGSTRSMGCQVNLTYRILYR